LLAIRLADRWGRRECLGADRPEALMPKTYAINHAHEYFGRYRLNEWAFALAK
jgi:hypothetical protein